MPEQWWTTQDEIAFINGLGLYSQSGKNRLELLAGYLAGWGHRSDWGGMDRLAAFYHAEASLKEAASAATRGELVRVAPEVIRVVGIVDGTIVDEEGTLRVFPQPIVKRGTQ